MDYDGDIKHFNISQVFPDNSDVDESELSRLKECIKQFKSNPPPGIFVTEVLDMNDPRKDDPRFEEARAIELAGLAEKGAFELVIKEDIAEGSNVLGGRFVLSIKNMNTDKEIYKARFVVQGHKDLDKNYLVYSSSNLKQSSIRIILSIASLFRFHVWSQDITHAYLQSASKLMRNIYVKPTKQFKLSKDSLLKLLKPFYGLTDSGDYWHNTFTSHIREDLHMVPTISDPALFFKIVGGKIA